VVRAKKSLGQNFLADPHHQLRIAQAVAPQPDDEILEIGPGTGAITQHLAGSVRRFIGVELDNALAPALAARYAADPSVTILHRDFLDLAPHEVSADPAALKVVGNIPYYITTPILFRLLERRWRPREITVMVQKEVADRILAPAGDRQYGALSVGVRAIANAERLFHVPRGAFRPAPSVDSTVLRITPLRPAPLSEDEERDLRELTRTAFGWRRKQLQRILRSADGYRLSEAESDALGVALGFDLRDRPEALGPADFIRLARALRAIGRPYDGEHRATAPTESA
jgi:16S rRNA (adenine1518-N6/adenine1519-N6)-dimethyltransferase